MDAQKLVDSAQKRAILAILGMIENGIQQLKMLLSVDGPEAYVRSETPRTSAEPAHLSDDEDRMLEAQLERERQDMLAFEQKRARTLWSENFGDDT